MGVGRNKRIYMVKGKTEGKVGVFIVEYIFYNDIMEKLLESPQIIIVKLKRHLGNTKCLFIM